MKALYTGALFDGLVDCYVLEDERRVVSQRGIVRAITAKNDGPDSGRNAGDLPRYISRLPQEYRAFSLGPEIEISLPDGGTAIGREGSFLVELCDAYVTAGLDGKLHRTQLPLARNANRIKSAWAKVGIDALIDEATGWQRKRSDTALAGRLAMYLRAEQDGWRPLWDERCRAAMCTVYGWPNITGRWPRQAAGVMDWIYSLALPSEVYAEMKRRTPMPRHKNNLHQWVQQTVREMLVDDVRATATIADQSGSREEFRRRVYYHFRKSPLQLEFIGAR